LTVNELPTSRSDTVNRATAVDNEIRGPILSLDLGLKRVGVAVCDLTLVAITRLEPLRRSNWKRLLIDVRDLIRRFDAQAVVIGWPLRLDGIEGAAARGARQVAQKFACSLNLPVFLQDERLTSAEAEEKLRTAGYKGKDLTARIDSESAAIILRDFVVGGQQKTRVLRP
jgi:putative Holliday junction resolvase